MGQARPDRYRRAGRHHDIRTQRLKALERENKELRKANEILKLASAFFAQAELDRRLKS
jgi:transposase